MSINKYTILLISFWVTCFSYGQDIHFSQYFNSPLTLNPANTGDIDGIWRVAANYRNQWNAFPDPFNTTALSFDMPMSIKDKKIGVGIGFTHDESGSLTLTSDKLFLSGAYEHITLNQHIIRGGVQVGFTHKSIDSRKITLPNQYDNTIGDFNNEIWSGETGLNDKSSYIDIHIGGSWTKKYSWGKPIVGLSFFHVNFPKETFFDQTEHLHLRTVLTGELHKRINEQYSIVPRVITMLHKRATYLNIGTEVYYTISDQKHIKKDIFLGIFLRNNFSTNSDALIFNAGMVYDNIKLGISYDINISNLKSSTNYNGALEFALIYSFGYDKYKNYTIPCQRY